MDNKTLEENIAKIYNSDIFEDFRKDVSKHISNQSQNTLQSSYIEEIENPKPSILDGHEIVFEIKTIIFKQNEKLENIGAEIMNQDRFHIPVPIGTDHKLYAAKIFKRFVENLIKILKNEDNDE